MSGLALNWQTTTSGKICEFITSGSRDWKSYYSDHGAIFIRTQDINRDRLDLSEAAFVELPEKVEGKRSLVQPGDLLITITGANVGKVALVPEGIPEAYVSQSVGLMRLKDKGLGPYLHYYLQSEQAGRKHVAKMVYGIGRPVLSLQNLRDIPIFLPPVDEQRRIVAEIEKQFTRLEAGVAALKRVQAGLKRYRAAVLKAACEGKLVPTDAELVGRDRRARGSYETGEQLLSRILAERRAKWTGRGKYKEPAAPDTANLAPLPEGWTRATLDQLCPLFADSAHRTPKYGEAGLPALGPRDVVGGKLNLIDARLVNKSEFATQTARHVPRPGDIVYSRELSLGWGAVVPDGQRLCMSQGMCLFRPHDNVNLRYFLAVLNGPVGRKQAENAATGSAHPHINLGDIKAYTFPLPPLAEQRRIVAEVEQRLSVIDELETVVSANLQHATRLRQSILQRAFSNNRPITSPL